MFEFLSLFLITLLGWVSGKLINYLADVLPSTRRINSVLCKYCQKAQPIDTYINLSYRCPSCGAPYPRRTWIIDLCAVFITLWLWLSPPAKLGFWFGWLLCVYLGIVIVVDIEHRLILNPISLIGAFLGAVIGIWRHGLWFTFLGGMGGFTMMMALYFFGRLFASWIAKRRGADLTEVALGHGDVNLAGIVGLLLGWPGIVAGLGLTIILGGIGGLIYICWQLLRQKYKAFSAIPYSPFMVLSVVILLFR
jgi:leader peptidase (prepilin peptidase)/N-methyltransferase